jgi:hypothetical protein
MIDAISHPNANGTLVKPNKDEVFSQLNTVTIKLFLILSGGAISDFVRALCFSYAGERVVARLRKELFEKIINQVMSPIFFPSM